MVIKVSWVLFVANISSQLDIRMSGHLVFVAWLFMRWMHVVAKPEHIQWLVVSLLRKEMEITEPDTRPTTKIGKSW